MDRLKERLASADAAVASLNETLALELLARLPDHGRALRDWLSRLLRRAPGGTSDRGDLE